MIFASHKKINFLLLLFAAFLLGFYVYQSISISSGRVALLNLKKEFLENKNNLNSSALKQGDYDVENLKLAEIEKFDYIIIGPSEFALIQGDGNVSQ